MSTLDDRSPRTFTNSTVCRSSSSSRQAWNAARLGKIRVYPSSLSPDPYGAFEEDEEDLCGLVEYVVWLGPVCGELSARRLHERA